MKNAVFTSLILSLSFQRFPAFKVSCQSIQVVLAATGSPCMSVASLHVCHASGMPDTLYRIVRPIEALGMLIHISFEHNNSVGISC